MKRPLLCLILTLLCASANFAQAKRGGRLAAPSVKPGYYFTVDMCRACYYANWATEIARLLQQQGVPATLYEGAMMESKQERFLAMKIFPRRGLWKDLVYVGPFASEAEATAALDKLPSVLSFVQKKRNQMEGKGAEGWPLSDDKKVTRAEGNDYRYGFYEIKGVRLLGP